MTNIRQVKENKKRTDELADNKVEVYSSEEILGSMQVVMDFAEFYTKHSADFDVLKTSLLIDYCNTGLFTVEQLNAFKMGLDGMFSFFEDCEADTNSYLSQAKKSK